MITALSHFIRVPLPSCSLTRSKGRQPPGLELSPLTPAWRTPHGIPTYMKVCLLVSLALSLA